MPESRRDGQRLLCGLQPGRSSARAENETGTGELMEKIISLFQRNYDGDHLVRDELVPGAEWVVAGEGIATRKFDGTCVKIDDGRLFKRYDFKTSKGRSVPPEGWTPAQPEPDPVTTSWPGWIEVDRFAATKPEDQWFIEAYNWWRRTLVGAPADGTYELCGPKVQGNPERFAQHQLIPHGLWPLDDAPRDFAGLREYLDGRDIEGIVWHHPDGRMVKVKGKDFGLKRPLNAKGAAPDP